MDVLSLPVNVQRRIALLLEDPDVTVADIDTVANRDVQRHMPDQLRRRSSDGPEGGASWVHDSGSKTHAIAAELNSASAAVVDTGYLGSQHLQVQPSLPHNVNACMSYSAEARSDARRLKELRRNKLCSKGGKPDLGVANH